VGKGPRRREGRMKTGYSYDYRDSEQYRYLYKVEQKVNEMLLAENKNK